MIKALGAAATGLINAQKRATELAGDIIKTTSSHQSEPSHTRPDTDVNSNDPADAHNAGAKAGSQDNKISQSNLLIQQITEFKLTEIQFRANASAFKRIADTAEVSLGALLDKKS